MNLHKINPHTCISTRYHTNHFPPLAGVKIAPRVIAAAREERMRDSLRGKVRAVRTKAPRVIAAAPVVNFF